MKDFLTSWLEDHVKLTSKSASTYDFFASLTNNHLIHGLGGLPVQRVTPETIQRFYRETRESGRIEVDGERKGNPLSVTTVRAIHNALRRAMEYAVAQRIIPNNPTTGASPPPPSDEEPEHWWPDETTEFLEVARGSTNELYFVTMLYTGLRPGEAAGLKWEDLSLDDCRIRVRRTLRKPGPHPTFGPPKTKSGRRTIAISGQLVQHLRSHRTAQKREKMQYRNVYEDHGLVFAQPNGNSIHPNNIQKREFSRLIERAGITRITLHGLRHTHATALLLKGVHPKIVQERLGHSSIRVTMDRYSHVIPDMQDEAAAALDDMMEPKLRLRIEER